MNDLATSQPLSWFERNVIATVPGALRRCRPRASIPVSCSSASFVSMNLDRHLRAHRELYQHLVDGDEAAADVTESFYDEYFAVLDITAEFYLETVEYVFQEHRLARGVLEFQGRRGRPRPPSAAPRCSPSRASATTSARPARRSPPTTCAATSGPMRKRHHLQPGVGHYGVFNGRRWEGQIYPLVHNLILANG